MGETPQGENPVRYAGFPVIIAKRQFSQSVSDIDKMAISSIMDSRIQTKFIYSEEMIGGRRLLESSLRSTEEEVPFPR